MNRSAFDEVIHLWPEGPPSKLDGVGPEVEFRGPVGVAVNTRMLRNVSEPTLTVFRPTNEKPNGVGVIVCPGGGWRILAWEHEGIDASTWLAARGYTAFLLKYRVRGTPANQADYDAELAQAMSGVVNGLGKGRAAPRAMSDIVPYRTIHDAREAAADDGRRAIEIVRERAKEWAVEKIGMLGFSAGAFLAVDVAVDPRAAPLAFVAPIYGGETLGRPVPADAPPLFTVHRAGRRAAVSGGRRALRGLERCGAFRGAAHLPPRRPRLWHGEAGRAVGPLDQSIPRLARRSRLGVAPWRSSNAYRTTPQSTRSWR